MGKDTQGKAILKKRLRPIGPTARREFSSGGIVFRGDKWLVTKSSESKLYPKTYWRLPKGWIDNDSPDTPGPMASGRVKATDDALQEGALREVREEGGVEARVIKKIGTEKYVFTTPDKGKILKFVTFYLMEWFKDLPEGYDGETSEIAWLPFDKAVKTLSFSGEKQMLKKAKELLAPVA